MRLSSVLLGVAAFAASVSANDPNNELDPDDEVADDEAKPTTFNGQIVPPLLELGPDNWDKEVKASKWLFVKHFSPWCPHCIDFAPTFQTLYEYYYTSTPSGSGNGAVDFSTFYDFRFAMINCIAYNDLCTAHGIASWPTITLYKDGEEAQKIEGSKSMPKLSAVVEDALEKTKPGTRPATLDLPNPGDKFSPDKAKAATAKAAPPNSKTDSKPSSQQKPLGKDKPGDKAQPAKEETKPELIVAPGTPDRTNPNPQAPLEEAKLSSPKGAGKPSADEVTAARAAAAAAATATAAAAAAPAAAAPGKGAASDKSNAAPGKDASSDKSSVLPGKDAASSDKSKAAPGKDASSDKSNAPPGPYRAPPKKTAQIAPDTNPQGTSEPLNAETFQSRVTMTRDPWFVKFYAPWCHHCQAMAATWEQLAKSMKGKLNIGEVNCDAETRLCKDVALRGYPTIVFFRGPEHIEYDGLRGLGDFVQFSEKAIDIGSGVQDVDAGSLKELEEKEEVVFVYFYDHATTSEDFTALDRLPLSLIGHAKLVKTRDPALFDRFKISTWPRMLVSREGRPTYYTPLTPNDMRNTQQVLSWMKSVWLPIVPELTASNAHEIMDGKIVVLGILNREDQNGFHSAKREMKSAANEWMDKQIQLFQLERQEMRDAKQLRIEEAEDSGDQRALRAAKSIRINMDKTDRKEVAFAWVDGRFWHRWVRTTYGIDIKDGEKVIINDEDASRYWDQTITGNAIVPSRTSILETLNKVTASPPKIKPRLTISGFEKAFFDTRMVFSEHPLLTLGCVLGLGLGLGSWLRGRFRRTRGGHFRLEENGVQHKAPLTGININGKVD